MPEAYTVTGMLAAPLDADRGTRPGPRSASAPASLLPALLERRRQGAVAGDPVPPASRSGACATGPERCVRPALLVGVEKGPVAKVVVEAGTQALGATLARRGLAQRCGDVRRGVAGVGQRLEDALRRERV